MCETPLSPAFYVLVYTKIILILSTLFRSDAETREHHHSAVFFSQETYYFLSKKSIEITTRRRKRGRRKREREKKIRTKDKEYDSLFDWEKKKKKKNNSKTKKSMKRKKKVRKSERSYTHENSHEFLISCFFFSSFSHSCNQFQEIYRTQTFIQFIYQIFIPFIDLENLISLENRVLFLFSDYEFVCKRYEFSI